MRDVTGSVCVPASSRATISLPWLGVIVGAGLVLAGCARVGAGPAGSPNAPVPTAQMPSAPVSTALALGAPMPDTQVTVAPGVVFALPPPATLGRSVEAQQLITARYRNDTFSFEASISATPARLLVVGTDSLGRRAMTIEWTGNDLKVKSAPWVPVELRALNIVADIMLLHWPQAAVRAGLAPDDAVREVGPGHRVIAVNGRDMISIDREDGASGSWSGRWHYRNLGWGYDLDIQSAEATP